MKKPLLFALLLAALPAAAQDLTVSPVAGSIHVIMGRGGNIGVSAGIKAGKSLEELQAAGAGDELATWGGGFISTDRWIATLHRDLSE